MFYPLKAQWFTCLFTYILTYFLTPWSRVLLQELTGSQLIKRCPAFYGTRRFITTNTSVRHLSLSCSTGPRHMFVFRNKASFNGEELSVPRPTPKLEDHPLSDIRDCLFSIFAATLPFGSRSSIRNLRSRHCEVTGSHLSQ